MEAVVIVEPSPVLEGNTPSTNMRAWADKSMDLCSTSFLVDVAHSRLRVLFVALPVNPTLVTQGVEPPENTNTGEAAKLPMTHF